MYKCHAEKIRETNRMFRALIVDDEPKVCNLIKMLGNWDDLSIEIIDICHDGDDAYEKIISLDPDIVLSDIRMPGLDGLELIEKCKKNGSQAEFIILSGYGLFEYAQKAMEFGVTHYLLKPINSDQLNKVLQSVCEKRRLQNGYRNNIYAADQIIKKEKRQILSAWITQNLSGDTDKRNKIHPDTSVPDGLFDNEQFFIGMLITNDPDFHDSSEAFLTQVQSIICDAVHEMNIQFIQTRDGIFFLIPDKGKRSFGALAGYLKNTEKSFLSLIEIFGHFHCAVYLHEKPVHFLNSKEWVSSFQNFLRCKMFINNLFFITEEFISKHTQKNTVLQTADDLNLSALELSIETLNREKIEQWFLITGSLFRDEKYCQAVIIEKIMTTVDNAFNQIRRDLTVKFIMKEEAELREKIGHSLSIDIFLKNTQDYCLELVQKAVSIKQESEIYPIRTAKNFIQEHISGALSLETVAEYINYSPSYFSTLFRNETGVNFKDYVLQTRINLAKQLLINTDESIMTISEKVGFISDKHFRKTFKEMVGIKPKEYRDLYK